MHYFYQQLGSKNSLLF